MENKPETSGSKDTINILFKMYDTLTPFFNDDLTKYSLDGAAACITSSGSY